MPKALVLGGAGYIGSHTCKVLKSQNIDPVVYDNLSRGHSSAVQWGKFINGDLHDTQKLANILRDESIEIVLHFAAYAYIKESMDYPELYYNNNVGGTLALLEAMKIANVRKIVFSSSCATYGIANQLPITENCPQNPVNPYGFTKLIAEKMLLDFQRAYGFEFCALRYFNAAGADPDGDIGESHEPEPHIIPRALQAALGRLDNFAVFGNDYNTNDGTCVRDFVHVTDLAKAHALVAQALLDGKQIDSFYNLSNSKGFSLLQIIENVERITGHKVPYQMKPRRPGDPPTLIGSSQNFINQFSWKREFSDIDTILNTAYNWLKHR